MGYSVLRKRNTAIPQIWLIRQKICFAIPQKSGRAKRKFCRKSVRHHPAADSHAPALHRTGSYPAAGGAGDAVSPPKKSHLPILGTELKFYCELYIILHFSFRPCNKTGNAVLPVIACGSNPCCKTETAADRTDDITFIHIISVSECRNILHGFAV